MPLNYLQYYNMPGTASRQVHPAVSFGWLVGNVLPGVTKYIKEGPFGAQPTEDAWLAGVNRSFDVVASRGGGITLTLVVETSVHGMNYELYDNILISLPPNRSITIVSDYVVPHWTVKFAIYNPTDLAFSNHVMIAARSR